MREPGYYWVKATKNKQWEPIFWFGQNWADTVIGRLMVDRPLDGDFYSIHPTRILNPDEVKDQSIAKSTE